MSIQIDKDAFPKVSKQAENTSQAAGSKSVDRKYQTLHIYSGILQVIGWIAVGIGFIVAVIGLVKFFEYSYGSIGFAGIMSGSGMALAGVVLIAMGQLICVWVDTEENTRRIAGLLENKK